VWLLRHRPRSIDLKQQITYKTPRQGQRSRIVSGSLVTEALAPRVDQKVIRTRGPLQVIRPLKANFFNIASVRAVTSNVMIRERKCCMLIYRNETVRAIRHSHPRARAAALRFPDLMKCRPTPGDAERRIERWSQALAEREAQLVSSARLVQAVSEYVEWWTFAFWVRLTTDLEGRVSKALKANLEARCPGFLEYAKKHSEQHRGEREFLWLRLIEWIDGEIFHSATEEGWSHALGYYAARNPTLDRVRQYWATCKDRWKIDPPAILPSYDDWRRMAEASTPTDQV
jgi:hypothetical protein